MQKDENIVCPSIEKVNSAFIKWEFENQLNFKKTTYRPLKGPFALEMCLEFRVCLFSESGLWTGCLSDRDG